MRTLSMCPPPLHAPQVMDALAHAAAKEGLALPAGLAARVATMSGRNLRK